MREKYIREEFELYNDNAGSLFIGLNSSDEVKVDITNIPKDELEKIIKKYEELLERYIKICLSYAETNEEDFTRHYFQEVI